MVRTEVTIDPKPMASPIARAMIHAIRAVILASLSASLFAGASGPKGWAGRAVGAGLDPETASDPTPEDAPLTSEGAVSNAWNSSAACRRSSALRMAIASVQYAAAVPGAIPSSRAISFVVRRW